MLDDVGTKREEQKQGITHKKELGALIHHAAGFLMFVKKYFIGIS